MRKPENLARHELVGLGVTVDSSQDPSLKGIYGKVIDETRSKLIIETDKKVKSIIKKLCAFRFTIPESGETVKISGACIFGRPEDRIKMKR